VIQVVIQSGAEAFEFTDGNEGEAEKITLTLVNDRIAQRLIGTFGYSM
jgi:hypothetical protein